MSNKIKIIIIYILMIVVTYILESLLCSSEPHLRPYCNKAGFIILINSILFLSLFKFYKLNKNSVTKFLLIILFLSIICISFREHSYSQFYQTTSEFSFSESLGMIIMFSIAPFVLIFDIIYKFGYQNFCVILIILYFTLFIFVSRFILSEKN